MTLTKQDKEEEFIEKLKSVVEAGDFCDQKLYREVLDEYKYHNIAPPHNFETCEICKAVRDVIKILNTQRKTKQVIIKLQSLLKGEQV